MMTSSENPWERRHPCLLASVNQSLPEASRHGCLRSQGFSFFHGVATRHEGSSGNDHVVTIYSLGYVTNKFVTMWWRADRPASSIPISARASSAAGSPVESTAPRFRPCVPSTGASCSARSNRHESRTELCPCDKAREAPAVPPPGRAESSLWPPSPPRRIIQCWRGELVPIRG